MWARTELYFGTSRDDGPPVSTAEFSEFLDQDVTPRFPDGLTLLTGYGQFRTSNGVLVRETSHVLILFYPLQMQEAGKRIHEIREEYKRRFRQESVLRVDSVSMVSF
jgi:hypothetical protein